MQNNVRVRRIKEMELQRLPEAELEIMMIVWEAEGSVNSDYIMEKLKGVKEWKRTTLLNLLTRLCGRGYLDCKKEGKINVYTPLIKEKDYLDNASRSFFEKLHKNSLTSLIASLYDTKSVSKEDLEELEKFIKEAE